MTKTNRILGRGAAGRPRPRRHDYRVRVVGPDELDALSGVSATVAESCDPAWMTGGDMGRIRTALHAGTGFGALATLGGMPVGAGFCTLLRDGTLVSRALGDAPGSWWVLEAVGVLPAHRGSGLQRRLIRARLREARRRGAISVAAVCHPGNTWSLDNLQACGLRVAGDVDAGDGTVRLLLAARLHPL